MKINSLTKLKYGVVGGVCFALYYLVPLEFRGLWQPDETRYAEISREMLLSGNWYVPRFLDLRYFEKPVAGYWINSISQLVFGHNNFSVRFGSVFSVTLSALLTGWLAYQLWRDKVAAIFSGVVFLSCLLVYGIGTYSVLDPMITLWLTAAMCSFWLSTNAKTITEKIGCYLLLGFTCGMGIMTKGFLALVVPVLGILPWIIVQKRWKDVLQYGVFAVFAVVLIVLPWAWAIHAAEPDFWHYFFWVEHIQRFSGENAQHKAPFWFYIPILIVGSLPWFALLPGALMRGWQERQAQRGTLYLLGWAVIPFLFFSITKGKLLTYIMPCFSPLAILMAHHAVQWARTGGRKLHINGWINVAFGVTGVVIVLTVLAPWGGRYSIYAPTETVKMLFACLAFTFWAGFGAMALDPRRWYWAAGCPLGIALLVGAAIPEKVSNAEQPQAFIREVHSQLEDSRYILTNNVGVGAAIAWEIKRSDIYLYSHKGELRYGLGYEDAEGRYIAQHAFVDWLAEHRREGKVTLLLLAPKQKNLDGLALPAPDRRLDKGRLVLFEYERRP